MKTYIIDALNLIHKEPSLRNLLRGDMNNALNGLIQKVSLFASRYKSYKFKIVIDGSNYELTNPYMNIKVITSGKRKADPLIKELIDKAKNKRSLTIVSSDTEVYNYGKVNACTVKTSEEFLSIMEPPKPNISNKDIPKGSREKPSKPSRKEVDEFLKLFGEK
jgi:predicted RNA-binding protein with PIN domain